jgi:hypothetical protein
MKHLGSSCRTYLAGLLLLLAAGSGCVGYRAGAASMFPADIQTVYVPMFESDSYRRTLGERLTEIVVKEIEERTPYKVVSSPDADSILTGKIVNDTKRVIAEDKYDQPRLTQMNFIVHVSWVDRKGDLVSQATDVPIPAQLVELSQSSELIPEFGQSTATTQQDALVKLGRQIVGLMENPW